MPSSACCTGMDAVQDIHHGHQANVPFSCVAELPWLVNRLRISHGLLIYHAECQAHAGYQCCTCQTNMDPAAAQCVEVREEPSHFRHMMILPQIWVLGCSVHMQSQAAHGHEHVQPEQGSRDQSFSHAIWRCGMTSYKMQHVLLLGNLGSPTFMLHCHHHAGGNFKAKVYGMSVLSAWRAWILRTGL